MKLVCQREALLSACQLANGTVPTRDIKPVLRNFKAIAKPEGCTLLATDMEVGVRMDLPGVQVERPGEVLLPAARTHAILRECPDETLAIETSEQACLVRGDHSEFELCGEDPAHFPDVPDFTAEQYHEFTAGTLREMIHRTAFAAAEESTRYALTGILWELDGTKVRLVATDGRRLAVADGTVTPHGSHATNNCPHVVPTKGMHLLERNLRDPDEPVRVHLGPNEALFKTQGATIYSRLVEGRYPPYREVFPKKPTTKIVIGAGSLHAAVRQAAVMTDRECCKVTFNFAKNKLTLQAQGAESGRSKVELCLDYTSKPTEIAFNPRLLTEMLRVLPPEESVSLELTDSNSAALFRCGDTYAYIVMPLT